MCNTFGAQISPALQALQKVMNQKAQRLHGNACLGAQMPRRRCGTCLTHGSEKSGNVIRHIGLCLFFLCMGVAQSSKLKLKAQSKYCQANMATLAMHQVHFCFVILGALSVCSVVMVVEQEGNGNQIHQVDGWVGWESNQGLDATNWGLDATNVTFIFGMSS